MTNQNSSDSIITTKTKQTTQLNGISIKNKKEREARIQWTTSNQQLNMLVVRQMKKPVIKAFTIDYNPDRYEKGKKIWRV